MEHSLLSARLEAAKRRAKLGQDQIDRQRLVVATLFATGTETAEAENRLRVFEELHHRYIDDMRRILIALDEAPYGVGPFDFRDTGPRHEEKGRIASSVADNLAVKMPGRMAENRHHDGEAGKKRHGPDHQQVGDDEAP